MIREIAKKLFNDEAGVSPIVATLVLIVVAIAGAAAVGTIMGSFSSDVSDSTNSEAAATGSSTELIVAGSTTVQPVSELIAKEYMKKNKGVKITVQGGGSGAGIASAGMGIVDIGAASKFMSDSDKTKFPELKEHVIGGSAVVIIRNNVAGFTATNVSKAELTALYNNVADTGVTIGGTAAPTGTVVYQRTEASGTEETLAKFAVNKDNVDDALANSNTVLGTAIGNQGVLDAVKSSTAPAIGFVDFGFADHAITNGAAITILKVGPTTMPTVDSKNVKTAVKDSLAGKTTSTAYEVSLCRPLVYLTNGDASSLTNNYLQFAKSPAALEMFKQAGYFGITELQ